MSETISKYWMRDPEPWTKGPWHIEPSVRRGAVAVRTHGKRLVGECVPPGQHMKRVAEAASNGFLFAAAPDLYDALARIVAAHESGNNGMFNGHAVLCEAYAKAAKAALARARGMAEAPT